MRNNFLHPVNTFLCYIISVENEVTEFKEKIEKTTKTGAQSFWEVLRFAILAVAIVIPIRIFIAQPFIVSGSSMVPTFLDKQYLIVDEISYHLGDPKRFDVVIFRYPKDPKKFFIKRIIGLPNETVDVKGKQLTITNKENPDGLEFEQPYVKNQGGVDGQFKLGDNEYFVLGDNRGASSDSRYWGAVDRKLLMGRAFLRLFPLKYMDIFPGSYEVENE